MEKPFSLGNPFPGMNPFFEQRWRDAHTRLITYLCDALQENLPPDLVAGAEEKAVTIGTGDLPQTFRPDVQVRKPWPPSQTGALTLSESAAAAPIRLFMDEEIERWIEIHDATGRLITVLELLSPGNKRELAERDRYQAKCRSFISAGVNLVEIDLVRQGASVFPALIRDTLRRSGACYGISLFRASRPAEREIYPIRLRDRLPAIRIPLRPADEDVILELQPLINQCHERGRYHRLDYRDNLIPPLTGDDAAWADALLRAHGLRQASP